MTTTAAINQLNPADSLKLNIWEGFVNTSLLPLQQLKYCPLIKAYSLIPEQVLPILDKMVDFSSDQSWGGMRVLVDYKVRDLKAGDCGCPLDFWHLDVTENPNHSTKPDIHYLYSTHFGTEFITTPMDVFEEDISFKQVLGRNKDFEYVTAKPNTINRYTRANLHRGPRVTEECRRMLLRLTLTEVIK